MPRLRSRALPALVNAVIQNGGQTCSAGSRLLVEASAFERVTDAVAERFRTLRAGRPDADPDLGPMINRRQKERVEAYFSRAAAEEIPRLASGSVSPDAPTGGFFVPPSFFAPVAPGCALAQEEVFGPVLVATPFADEAEAVSLANGTAYGLVAGIWTGDAIRAPRVARAMRRA